MSLQPSKDSHPPKRPRTGERTMLACIDCKQKKLKCDGQSPKCQNCKKSGRDCLVEDPATGLHRPRDYLKSLEARVAYLETLLQQVRPDVALDHLGPIGRAQVEESATRTVLAANSPSSSRTGQTASQPARQPSVSYSDDQQTDLLSSEVALLCLSAAGREPHYFGPSSAVSFSRLVSATMGLAKGGAGSNSQQSVDPGYEESHVENPRHDPVVRLPSSKAGAKLIRAYFDNIHPQYPFLHQPAFNVWEEQFRKGTHVGNMNDAEAIPLFFVLMVYAIGSLTLGQNQDNAAEMYYSMALDYISPVLASNGLESIQCILSCAVYSIRSPVGVSLWKISGMAIRHCIELGYHRSSELYHRDMDTLTKEMIKRCFWVAYDLDRVAAFTLGRPVGIPEECIDIELPSDIDDEHITPSGLLRNPRDPTGGLPTVMTGALHVIWLRRLWAKFSQNLYMRNTRDDSTHKVTIESLRRELDDWRTVLPDQFNSPHSRPLSVFSSSEWFQIAYDHSILLLYRPYITRTVSQPQSLNDHNPIVGDDEQETIDRAFEECSVRAREMCLLYRRIYQSSTIQFTWGSLHILFLGGLTYLYCLWRSKRVQEMTRQADVVSTCMACTTVLVIIAERWNLATSYRDLFETLSERTISMIFGDGNLAGPSQRPTTGPWASFNEPIATEAPLQDWIVGLNEMSIPQESEWLVQELLRGDSQFLSEPFYGLEEHYTSASAVLPDALSTTGTHSGEIPGDQ